MNTLSNYGPGPWKEVSSQNGIRIVEVDNFESFFRFVNVGFGDADRSCIWRGQRCPWEIKSTLARENVEKVGHLEAFRNAVARCTHTEYDIGSKNPNSENEILKLWSLGQHNGLLTPLVDWTIYPFVALFFAFVEKNGETQNDWRAVFALDLKMLGDVNFLIAEENGVKPFKVKLWSPPYSDEFKRELIQNYGGNAEIVRAIEESNLAEDLRSAIAKREYERLKEKWLRTYRPSTNENARLHSQGGLHLYLPDGFSVQAWIKTNQGLRHQGWQKVPLLVEVRIPNTERKAILSGLNKMNINHLTLFPDIWGAAHHANMALREDRIHSISGY
jgi:hypothetical protein